MPTAIEIEKLCDDWCAASVTPGGGMAIGANTEKFRLLRNGVIFHELDHEALCAAILGLSKVLLRPGLNTVIDQDHFGIWSWCGELLLNPRAQLFPVTQHEIRSLYEAALHASLAGCRKPPETKEEWHEQNRILEMQPHHSKQLLRESHLVLAYLTFPLLEAVLKRSCATFVALDGQVISAFSVSDKQGRQKRYAPDTRNQCSSIRDLLILHHDLVAGLTQRSLIDRFRAHIGSLDGTRDPFDLIYAWRNQSLHGSTSFHTIGGILLNLSLLISLFEIEHEFDKYRSIALQQCRREAMSPSRSPWSFYPPY